MTVTGFWALKVQCITCFYLEDVQLRAFASKPTAQISSVYLPDQSDQSLDIDRYYRTLSHFYSNRFFPPSPCSSCDSRVEVEQITDHSCYAPQDLLWSNLKNNWICFCCHEKKYFLSKGLPDFQTYNQAELDQIICTMTTTCGRLH